MAGFMHLTCLMSTVAFKSLPRPLIWEPLSSSGRLCLWFSSRQFIDKVWKYPLWVPFKGLTCLFSGPVSLAVSGCKRIPWRFVQWLCCGFGTGALRGANGYSIRKPWLFAFPYEDCFSGTHAQLAALKFLNTGWTSHFVNLRSTSWIGMSWGEHISGGNLTVIF